MTMVAAVLLGIEEVLVALVAISEVVFISILVTVMFKLAVVVLTTF